MQIAILDNDTAQYNQLAAWLAGPTAVLQRFTDLDTMLRNLREGKIDLMVVHWQSAIDRRRLKEAIERRSPPVPLVLVAERTTMDSLTLLLDYSACDYVLKPLRRMDLVTRVHVLKKRFHVSQMMGERHEFGLYVFDTEAEKLRLNDEPIRITQKEFRLALLFFRHLGRPLSRAFILESVWPDHAEFSSRSMDTHVSRVRNKLGLQPEHGYRLAPVYSYGYRLERIKA